MLRTVTIVSATLLAMTTGSYGIDPPMPPWPPWPPMPSTYSLFPGGDFETDTSFVEPGVSDYYRTPYQDSSNGVRSWQFDLDVDLGRWVGAGDISHHVDPRVLALWEDPDSITQLKTANRSEDPTSGNRFMEVPAFYSWVIAVAEAPACQIPGKMRLEFDWYFEPWDPEMIFPHRNLTNVTVWGIHTEDLPAPDPTRNNTIWWSPHEEIGSQTYEAFHYNADPASPNCLASSNGWQHFDSGDISLPETYDYYEIKLWGSAYGEEHPYDWLYDPRRPADTLTVAWDNVDLRVSVILSGDFNLDGTTNLLDINDFVLYMTNPDEWRRRHPNAPPEAEQCLDPSQWLAPGDPIINLLDIPYFIDLITGGSAAGACSGGLCGTDASTAIPEPATISLLAIAALTALRRRRANRNEPPTC